MQKKLKHILINVYTSTFYWDVNYPANEKLAEDPIDKYMGSTSFLIASL